MNVVPPTEDEVVAEFRKQVREAIPADMLEAFDSNPQVQQLIGLLGEGLRGHYQRTQEMAVRLIVQAPTPEDIKERLLRYGVRFERTK